jgi:hypothetical protein
MGMVKDSLFDVLEVALASLERIGRAWEEGDREMLKRVCKVLGEFSKTRDWEKIEDLLWLTQRLREVLEREYPDRRRDLRAKKKRRRRKLDDEE